MDLNALDTRGPSDEGEWVTITNPATYQPTDIRIRVLGPDSKRFTEAADRHRRALKKSGADADRLGAEFLSDITLEWDGVESEQDGELKPLQLSRDNAIWAYTQYPELARQVTRFAVNVGNFTRS